MWGFTNHSGAPSPLHCCTTTAVNSKPPSKDGITMDPEVWSELPDSVIFKILTLLPLRDFVRLRWVCRRWSRLLESPSFVDEFSRAKAERPWFAIVAGARKVYAHEPYAPKWYALPDGFLQPNAVVLATSKGLVLSRLSRRASGQLHDLLVMRNPLTGAERVLPHHTLFGCGYAMQVDEATKAYRVYHFGQLEPFGLDRGSNRRDDAQHTFEAFSSTTNCWQVLGHVYPETFVGLPWYAFNDVKVFVWGDYIICRLRGWFGVFTFSLTSRDWLQLPWAATPNVCEFQQILSSRDRLIMRYTAGAWMQVVGMKFKNEAEAVDSGCERIQLYQLPRGTLEWAELTEVPQLMNVMRYNIDSYGVPGDFVFMLFATKLLVFDAAAETWRFAPHCDRVCENLQEFCFEPRLDISA